MNKPLITFYFLVMLLLPTLSPGLLLYGLSPDLQHKKKLANRALLLLKEQLKPGHSDRIIIIHPASSTELATLDRHGVYHDLRAPGSLFKLLTAAHLLQSGRVPPGYRWGCKGRYYIHGAARGSGKLIHEDVRIAPHDGYYKCSLLKGHGLIGLQGAIAHSCNTFFYSLHSRVDWPALGDLFRRSGLSLYGGRLSPPQLLTRSILGTVGETARTTLASAAVFINAIINKGAVRRITRTGHSPVIARFGSASVLARLQDGMRACVRYGTGKGLLRQGGGYPIAAKTGTGRQGDAIFITDGWTISYAPAHNPRVLIGAFSAGNTGSGRPLANSAFLYKKLAAGGYFRR